MENTRASPVIVVSKSASSSVLDWFKTNWMWVVAAVVIVAGIGYFFWRKRKSVKVTAPEGIAVEAPAELNVSRLKQPGQPDLA